jgi:hypothetical protein
MGCWEKSWMLEVTAESYSSTGVLPSIYLTARVSTRGTVAINGASVTSRLRRITPALPQAGPPDAWCVDGRINSHESWYPYGYESKSKPYGTTDFSICLVHTSHLIIRVPNFDLCIPMISSLGPIQKCQVCRLPRDVQNQNIHLRRM